MTQNWKKIQEFNNQQTNKQTTMKPQTTTLFFIVANNQSDKQSLSIVAGTFFFNVDHMDNV